MKPIAVALLLLSGCGLTATQTRLREADPRVRDLDRLRDTRAVGESALRGAPEDHQEGGCPVCVF